VKRPDPGEAVLRTGLRHAHPHPTVWHSRSWWGGRLVHPERSRRARPATIPGNRDVRLAALTALLALWAAGAALGDAPPAKFEPPKGCYVGACIEDDPVAVGDPEAWEGLTGHPHAIYGVRVQWGGPFPFQLARRLCERGAALQVVWVVPDGVPSAPGARYLRGWAEAAGRAELPIFLCLICSATEAAPPAPVWRQVRAVMDRAAPNVAMVWWPPADPAAAEQQYPGDAEVDWVGVSMRTMHEAAADQPTAARDPREVLRWVCDLYAARKPVAISEYAAAHTCPVCGVDQTEFALAWAKQLYDALPDSFPRVKMINWVSAGPETGAPARPDYAVTDCPAVLNAYRALVGRPYFLDTVVAGEAPPPEPEEAQGEGEPLGHPGDLGTTIVLDPDGGVLTGPVVVRAGVPAGLVVDHVAFSLDGRPRLVATAPPFEFALDPAPLEPGEHLIELTLYDATDTVLDQAARTVVVGR